MSWAELLKKSAEYARKSLEELAAALRPPPNRAPSFEPAYSKYRHRGFLHPSPQRRAYCTANLKHFFGSNAPGLFTHPHTELARQQLELFQGIQHWPNERHNHWQRNSYRHWHNFQKFNKWSFGWFSEWHARWHARWHAKAGANFAARQNCNWHKKLHAKLHKVLCPRGDNNWLSVWHSNWHRNWETTIHYNVRHSWNDLWGSEYFNGSYNSQGGHQNDSGTYSWWTWSKEQHNRYHEWREQWQNHWQGREISWHHNTHDQWANHCKRNRQWRSEFPPYHHCRKQRRSRYSSPRYHPCFHPIWILLWFKIAVKCTNLVLVRSKYYATSRPSSLNLSQKIPAILPAFCQHSNKREMSPSVSKPSQIALFHTQAPTTYEELINYCERRSEPSRVNSMSLLESGRQSLKSAYVAMTEYTEASVAASIMSAWSDFNDSHTEAEGTVELMLEEGSPELTALDGTAAAVDFTILPRLSFSGIAGLNDETVEQIRNAISAHIASLHSVLEDINRIAELGELPVSLEQNGTVLRIHFPNSDVDRVALLTDDKGVESGDIVEVSSAPSTSSELEASVSSSVSSSSVSSLSASAESFVRVEAPHSETNMGSISSWSEGLIPAPRAESLDELWSALHSQVPGLTNDPSSVSDSTFPHSLATHD